jgi:hypothetical protein
MFLFFKRLKTSLKFTPLPIQRVPTKASARGRGWRWSFATISWQGLRIRGDAPPLPTTPLWWAQWQINSVFISCVMCNNIYDRTACRVLYSCLQHVTTTPTAENNSQLLYILHKLSKQNSIFLPSSYLLPQTVCKFKSVSNVAPISQVKALAQLLLQNAVDVLQVQKLYIPSGNLLILPFRMIRLNNKRNF